MGTPILHVEIGRLAYMKTRATLSECQIHLPELCMHSVSFSEHLIYLRSQDSVENQLLTLAPSVGYQSRETQMSVDAILPIY